MSEPQPASSSRLILIMAWLIVSLPAAWGIEQTIQKSTPLFRSVTPTTMPTAMQK